MQQEFPAPEDIAFGERLAFLRQSLSEADPLAVATPDMAHDADALAAAFHAATPDARAAYLLRALDDAIVALDLSAQLADEFTLTPGVPPTHQAADDTLYEAYRAFAASQPALQALYHYRNALAARLRLAPRDLPAAVVGDAARNDDGDAGGEDTVGA